MSPLIWIAMAVCIVHSALFSGLNLGVFGVSRLRLETEASAGSAAAERLLRLRRNAHFLLATILWGNVGANVLLTLLADSVMTGVAAFFFSTFGITAFGEIAPQAYFTRHAVKVGSILAPFLRFYQVVLWPVARPTALLLDSWLGPEGVDFLRERDMRELIRKHIRAEEAEIDHLEGIGALNFLDLDDLPVGQEGEPVDPDSLIRLPTRSGLPQIPAFEPSPSDPFIQQVVSSGKRWVILAGDDDDEPRLVLDADAFLRAVLSGTAPRSPYAYCHRPIVVRDAETPLGDVIDRLEVVPEHPSDDVIDKDLILLWAEAAGERRVITGADLLGRLLRGIARRR